jgi:thymidylate synthase (FAD)
MNIREQLRMTDQLSVLDHGYVKLLNLSGPIRRIMKDPNMGIFDDTNFREFDADDVDPAQSARMSFNQRDPNRPRKDDFRLNEYLIKNHHSTPIEMIETWWEMKLPIFVARQFVRHRTTTINEVSARYTALSEEWYIPKPENVTVKSPSNKQGRGTEQHPDADAFCLMLNQECARSYQCYKTNLEAGIPPELARSFLHINHYTHWLWKQNLHNLFHFLSLRDHPHAQWESQQYAKAMTTILEQHLPNLMSLYAKYRRSA